MPARAFVVLIVIAGAAWLALDAAQLAAQCAILLAASGAVLARAFTDRRERAAWLLIGSGVLAWTLGELYYTAALVDEPVPPIPSLADAGYLLFPVLTFTGMCVLLRRRASASGALLVDGIAAALAVAALSAAIVFQTVLEHAPGGLLEVATSLAYPLTDVILLAVAIGALAGAGWRLDRTWALLSAGILAFWFADSMYLVRTAEGAYSAWTDLGWWVGLVLIAAAAWQPEPAARRRHGGDSLRLIAAPLASGALGVELLIYGSTGRLNPLAVALAALSLFFVMLRLAMTFRQNVGMLRASRDEAMTDPLTGLGNRRALSGALDHALATARPEDPVVLALFDLDGFKVYNDTFGHPSGDALLARLGANLKSYLGARGQVFRLGGDEFCALFESRGEDVPTRLEGASLALSEHGGGAWISCSYGAVALPREARDAADAMRLADQRMYAQKHAGRMSTARQVKEALLHVLAAQDPRLERRGRAAANLAEAAARRLGLASDECEAVRLAAELHDAGRLTLPAAVPPRELALAGELLLSTAPALAPAARLVGASRERWDEAGEAIPLGARIIAAAVARHDGAPLDTGAFDPAVIDALDAARRSAIAA